MKFAREFRTALVKEGYPAHWVNAAIPYGQLKKSIKKVASELQSIGLDSETLAQLTQPSPEAEPVQEETEPGRRESAVAFQYNFDGTKETKEFRPKLTMFVTLEQGIAVDATLSKDTRKYLEKLARKQHGNGTDEERPSTGISSSGESEPEACEQPKPLSDGPAIQRVEIPLTFDAEFFDILQDDVNALEAVQADVQKNLTEEIEKLSVEITALTKPSKFSKTDMYRWRDVFDFYQQAGVFFSTRELDHGSRNSTTAAKQLEWFQGEVTKREIPQAFKLPASRHAFERFVWVNVTLLRNMKFQELNQLAMLKILKKFDKRTKLGATRTFPKLIHSSILPEIMAKAVCSQLSTDLVKTVPQLDDYLCPICFTMAWRPIRMNCHHIFCIDCTVMMQRQRKGRCPLCRENVIMAATTDNIDEELVKYLKRHFPKETKEKQIAIETKRGLEQFGIFYKHPSEYRCSVM